MSKPRVTVLAATVQGLSKADATRRYGVSRHWVHALLARPWIQLGFCAVRSLLPRGSEVSGRRPVVCFDIVRCQGITEDQPSAEDAAGTLGSNHLGAFTHRFFRSMRTSRVSYPHRPGAAMESP